MLQFGRSESTLRQDPSSLHLTQKKKGQSQTELPNRQERLHKEFFIQRDLREALAHSWRLATAL